MYLLKGFRAIHQRAFPGIMVLFPRPISTAVPITSATVQLSVPTTLPSPMSVSLSASLAITL